MSTVEEIEKAIEELPREDLWKLAKWFDGKLGNDWGRQMEKDAAAGRLDFLFEEATQERKAGLLKDWPPAKA